MLKETENSPAIKKKVCIVNWVKFELSAISVLYPELYVMAMINIYRTRPRRHSTCDMAWTDDDVTK